MGEKAEIPVGNKGYAVLERGQRKSLRHEKKQ